MTPAQAARVAADCDAVLALIPDEDHWVKGAYREVLDGADCYCLRGAMIVARVDWTTSDAIETAVFQLTKRYLVAQFNDAPTTTYADVRALVESIRDDALARIAAEASDLRDRLGA